MRNEEDETDLEGTIREAVEADQAETERRGRVSLWHTPQKKTSNHREWQPAQQLAVSMEFAKSLREQGIADIQAIKVNPDLNELPDCLAVLDGKPIGIEATELIASNEAHNKWCRDSFEHAVTALIVKKSDTASNPKRVETLSLLDQLFLVVFTDETYLSPETIADYLRNIRVTKPPGIDRAFVLGPYEPFSNAAIRGRELEPHDDKARFTAVEVRWCDPGSL